eukprot:46169_1
MAALLCFLSICLVMAHAWGPRSGDFSWNGKVDKKYIPKLKTYNYCVVEGGDAFVGDRPDCKECKSKLGGEAGRMYCAKETTKSSKSTTKYGKCSDHDVCKGLIRNKKYEL